ncbi:MAG TPA: prolipoprotein diacylglyceryl transferase [Vicinamibacterales bacterium]|nr:prolipoprotein diacylglyceryl transferase [Vicinamibacterales bacterium]
MHPTLFKIPLPFGLDPLPIASYGTMVALGALLGIYIASVRARRNGINPAVILDLALVVIISGLLGARIFFFAFDEPSDMAGKGLWSAFKQFINFPSGGLSFFGALALGIPAGIVFLTIRLRHEPGVGLWKAADISIPSIALGIAFARIGCYLNGCCFGAACSPSFPLAQVFPEGSAAADKVGWPATVYPTQFISSLNALTLFVVLSLLFRRRKFDGQLFCIFLIWYGITRGLIELLRADNPHNVFGLLTTWQAAGLLLALGGVALWIVLQRRRKQASASP